MINYKKVLFAGILGLTAVLLAGWFLSADLVEGGWSGDGYRYSRGGELQCRRNLYNFWELRPGSG